MRRVLLSAVVLAAVWPLAACGANSAAPPPSGTATTPEQAGAPETTTGAAPRAGVRPGIVLISCEPTAGQAVTVSGFAPGGTPTGSAEFAWSPMGAKTTSPAVGCADFGLFSQMNRVDGHGLRSGFNEDYTAAVGTDKQAENTTIGWLTPQEVFTAITKPVSGDFTKQDDHDPMFHVATDRVFYRDAEDKLMSIGADGSGQKPEALPDTDHSILVQSTAPAMEERGGTVVYNRSGTLVAGMLSAVVAGTDQIIVVPAARREDLRNPTSGVTVTGDFTGALELHGFLDDNTLLLTDSAQIYAVRISGQTAAVTTVLANDKLSIWDVTPSPDGKSVAFLAGEGASTHLYTVPATGGTPTRLATLSGAVALLEFTA